MNSLLIKITFVETCDLSCPYRQHAVFPASWTNHVIFPVWLFFFKLSVNPGLIINAIVFNSNIWNYFILDPRLFFFSLYYVFYRSRDIHLSEHTNLRNLDYNQYFQYLHIIQLLSWQFLFKKLQCSKELLFITCMQFKFYFPMIP